jgi:hypothetical protein
VRDNAAFGFASPRSLALTFHQHEEDTLAARQALACLFHNHLTSGAAAEGALAGAAQGGSPDARAESGAALLASCAHPAAGVPPDSELAPVEEGNLLARAASSDRAVAALLHAWSDAAWARASAVRVAAA